MLPKDAENRAYAVDGQVRDLLVELVRESSGKSEVEQAQLLSRPHDQLLKVLSTLSVDSPDDRTDEWGRARAGSQLQMQLFVNLFPDELGSAVLGALPELAAKHPRIEWRSPLAEQRYREYRDGEFLESCQLGRLRLPLTEFWPARGPRWDALALLHFEHQPEPGVLLLEAKAHEHEVTSAGCGAAGARRTRIEARLGELAARLQLSSLPESWMGAYYQSANRLAHLLFLRDHAIQAWLVNLYFSDDWHRPTGETRWRTAIAENKQQLGLTSNVPYAEDVVIKAKKLNAMSLPAARR